MSSIRNAAYRRNHPERPQPASRSKLGILEKHKDYVIRARDYNRKQDVLKKLRAKAQLRNPDEFYFAMSKAKVQDGVHVERKNFSEEEVKLIKDQHLSYINLQEKINSRKLNKLRESIQVTGSITKKDAMDSSILHKDARPAKHIIFASSDEEVDINEFAPKELKANQRKQRSHLKKEFYSRLERDKELKSVQQKYEICKNLASKGTRIMSKSEKKYKWASCRKR